MNRNFLLSASLAIVLTSATAALAQLPHTIMYLNFDDGTQPGLDLSIFGNDATLENAVHDPTGGRNGSGAVDFGLAGNSAYLDIPNAADGGFDSITSNDAYSLSFWAWGDPVNLPAQQTTGFHASGPDSGRIIRSHLPWENGSFYYRGTQGSRIGPLATESAAQYTDWHHYGFVYDGVTATATMYLDGEEFAADADGHQPIATIRTFVFGADIGGGRSYVGKWDELAMWNLALTPTQIADLAGGATPPVYDDFLRGDFNEDTVVNEVDFGLMALNLGLHLDQEVLHTDGDYNVDGKVDLYDLDEFKAANPAAAAAYYAAVPEPVSSALALVATCGLGLLGRRRS